MSKTPYIFFYTFYTLFTGPENPQSQAPLYDALTYIITNFSKKDKLWKRQRIPLSIKEKTRIDKIIGWIHEVQKFLQNLSLHDLLTLYAYTTPLYEDIQYFKCLRKIPPRNPAQNKIPVFEFLRHVSQKRLSSILPTHFMIRFQNLKKMPWIIFQDGNESKEPTENHVKIKEIRLFEKDVQQNPQIMDNLYHAGIVLFKNKMDPRILFYPQIQACIPRIKTLDDLTHQISNITLKEWRCIYRKYVTDLDNLFDRMPPLLTRTIVYRGEKRQTHALFLFIDRPHYQKNRPQNSEKFGKSFSKKGLMSSLCFSCHAIPWS